MSFPAVTSTCSRRHLTARRYWQFAQDRRITEEGLRYPMRSDAYRYYLDMENLNRKELLEAGVPARLLDEGYASFVEGEIQQMRRRSSLSSPQLLEEVRCWAERWMEANGAEPAETTGVADTAEVRELLDW